MRTLFALVAGLLSGLIPGAAARAQVLPIQANPPLNQPHLSVGDLHRFEMDRLRNQAEQSQSLARSQALQTQMTLQTLQAQRQPPLVMPASPVSAPTLEEAHRQREATEAATAAARQATGQIDSWLDRRPQ